MSEFVSESEISPGMTGISATALLSPGHLGAQRKGSDWGQSCALPHNHEHKHRGV